MKSTYQFVFFFLITISVSSQEFSKEHVDIKKVTLGYIESFFENDSKNMLSYLHPELAKRGISKRKGENKFYFENLSLNKLTEMLKKKKVLPKAQQKNSVLILDVFHHTASVRLKTGYPGKMEWIEYIHLSKVDNTWLITNIIWDYFPRKKRN